MGFLKNHLSGEDTPQARRPGTLAGKAQQARTPRPHRGLPAGAAADRAADVASHRLKHHLNRNPVPDWVPVPSAASGTPAGLPSSVPEGADAPEPWVVRRCRWSLPCPGIDAAGCGCGSWPDFTSMEQTHLDQPPLWHPPIGPLP
jgi:hypothetical protein